MTSYLVTNAVLNCSQEGENTSAGLKDPDKYTAKTVKFGDSSLMVWKAIKEDGTRILIRCPDRMNSASYEDVLKKGLLPMYDPQNIFQQDGAPCHKSRLVTSFLYSVIGRLSHQK